MKSSRSMIKLAAETDAARAGGRIVGMIDRLELLALAFRIILDHDLERPQHRHAPQRVLVEMLRGCENSSMPTSTTLLALATPMRLTNSRIASGGTPRRFSPAIVGMRGSSQPRDMAAAHQLGQHPLRQQRVGQIEPREFVLMRLRRHRQLVEQPFVERPVVLEFQRADRMRDALDRVGLAVGVVVARIDRPFACRCADGWRAGCDRARDRAD